MYRLSEPGFACSANLKHQPIAYKNSLKNVSKGERSEAEAISFLNALNAEAKRLSRGGAGDEVWSPAAPLEGGEQGVNKKTKEPLFEVKARMYTSNAVSSKGRVSHWRRGRPLMSSARALGKSC